MTTTTTNNNNNDDNYNKVAVGCETDTVSVHAVASDAASTVSAYTADWRTLGSATGRMAATWDLVLGNGDRRALRGSESQTLELRVQRPPSLSSSSSSSRRDGLGLITLLLARPPASECEPRLSQLAVVCAHSKLPLALKHALSSTSTVLSLSAPVPASDAPLLVALSVSQTCRVQVTQTHASDRGGAAEQGPLEPFLIGRGGGRESDRGGDRGGGEVLADQLTGPWDAPLRLTWQLRPGANALHVQVLRADDAALIRAYTLSASVTVTPPLSPLSPALPRAASWRRAWRRAWPPLRWILLALLACAALAGLHAGLVATARRCAFALSSGWALGRISAEEHARAPRVAPQPSSPGPAAPEFEPIVGGAAPSGVVLFLAAVRAGPLELGGAAKSFGVQPRPSRSGRQAAAGWLGLVPCPRVVGLALLLVATGVAGLVVELASRSLR
eukprot:CAMPEP_0179855756 /NCGR_PEP_ID=MMETSP0982-20121206/10727_1 /TAXON_ID=483367 /ORGANISM="non described non described, Strain CCMP 2436" /LENGTH=444 /DNA_ID=CAMNT_0021741911 /DNA_START=727 /DNA_END=2062 /DNA_ORIENTATION=+